MKDPKTTLKYHLGRRDKLDSKNIPTLRAFRYGNTQALAKLSPYATKLAIIADQAQRAYSEVYESHWGILNDPLQTEAARIVKAAANARSKTSGIEGSLHKALDDAERELGFLRSRLSSTLAPPTDAGQALQDQEARAIIRAQTDPVKQLELARKFPRATATATYPELVGLAKEAHENIRNEYLHEHAKDTIAEYNDLLAAVSSATEAVTQLDKDMKDLVDFQAADEFSSQAYRGE